ncbi:MAG TPA: pitrilysin family protein [Terriglobales bacterium]|nr:pitrilysin family protein [Terriglobales bacterium]
MKAIRQTAVALLFASTLWAQGSRPPLPADLPKAGVLKPPTSPAVEQHKLKNGLDVWLVQRPELPKVAFDLVVRGGDSLDPAYSPGLAKVMARAITQGTSSRSSREIAEAAQAAGGDLGSFATVDWTQVSLDSLSEHAGDAVSLLADVAQNANFPESEVALVKSNMQDELRSSEARPRFLAQRAWYGVTFGDHPYHIVAASMKTLQSATPKSLQALYQTEFRPDQSLLIAVGSFDKTALMADIEKAFGSWKAPTFRPAEVKTPATKPDHKIYYIERPGSVQTTMLIGSTGLTATDPDEPRLRVANTIYGGSFGSRLTRNIREDKGYTYTPYSYTPNNRLAGACLTSEDVRNEVTGASLKETFGELKRIASEPPSAGEMDTAKRYLIGNTALELQSRGEVGALLAKYWVIGEPATHLDKEMAEIQKTTPAEAAQVAAKYLNPDRVTIIAVGEKQVILDQLKPFGMEIVPAPKE